MKESALLIPPETWTFRKTRNRLWLLAALLPRRSSIVDLAYVIDDRVGFDRVQFKRPPGARSVPSLSLAGSVNLPPAGCSCSCCLQEIYTRI
jgi:hypothetical protein